MEDQAGERSCCGTMSFTISAHEPGCVFLTLPSIRVYESRRTRNGVLHRQKSRMMRVTASIPISSCEFTGWPFADNPGIVQTSYDDVAVS